MSGQEMLRKSNRHIPVLSRQVMRFLNPQPGHIILDATVGTGSQARLFLSRIVPDGYLIGLDKDKEMLRQAAINLNEFSGNFQLFHANFADLDSVFTDSCSKVGNSRACPLGQVQPFRSHTHLRKIGSEKFDGVFLDLGVSSVQLDSPDRGFSFTKGKEGPLDMRMDRSSRGPRASDLIAELSQDELERLFTEFGEERWAQRISKAIVRARATRPIETTTQLAQVISACIPPRKRERGVGNEDVLARVFMSLRIVVNDELNQLERFLNHAWKLLKPNARIAIADFHSLEDRIVKKYFLIWSKQGFCKILTKNPIRPSPSEIANNPRSRSAKLRVAERIPF